MKKIFRLLVIALLPLAITSCVDDPGNYDYEPKGKYYSLKIEGVKNGLRFPLYEEVEIEPEIEGMDDEANYEFLWHTYSNLDGLTNRRDTLGYTKNVKFTASYPLEKVFVIVLEVKDKRTGVKTVASGTFNTITELTSGLFILKEVDGKTDVDYINYETGAVKANVLSMGIGRRMEGKPVKLAFQQDYSYLDDNGVIQTDINVFYVLSEKEFVTVKAGDFSPMKFTEDQFYYPQEAYNPQDIVIGEGPYPAVFIMNDGKIHGFNGFSKHPSKFPHAALGPEELYPAIIANPLRYWGLVFDRGTDTFYFTKGYDDMVPATANSSYTSPVNMDMDMIFLMPSNERVDLVTEPFGWALMRDRTPAKAYHLFGVSTTGQGSPAFFTQYDFTNDRKLFHADVWETSYDRQTIYFAKDNVLSYYARYGTDDMSVEEDIKVFDPDEKIENLLIITGIYGRGLYIQTTKGDQWKMYRYQLYVDKPGIDEEHKVWSEENGDWIFIEPFDFAGYGKPKYVVLRQ